MSFFLRIEGLDPEDLSDDTAHDLADRVFAEINRDYPDHYEKLTGVIPVLNEDEHARLVEAATIERPTEQDEAIIEPEMATDGGTFDCGDCGDATAADDLKALIQPDGDGAKLLCPECQTSHPYDRQYDPADPAAVLGEDGDAR
jgi:hypothetical protein